MKESVKRMGRKCARGLLALAAVFAAGPLFGAVTPGEWGGKFGEAKACAEAQAVPLVVFWGSPGCGQCSKLWREISGSEFKNWMANSGEGGGAEMVFVHCEGTDSDDAKACKTFAKTANGNVISKFPFIRIYWRNAAGEVVTVNFPGRKSTMPASSKGRTLAGQLIASIQAYTWGKGYQAVPAYVGGAFAVAGDVARLEIEEGLTKRVEIPFRREPRVAGLPAKNILTVTPIGRQAVVTTNTVPGEPQAGVTTNQPSVTTNAVSGEPTVVVTTNFVNWAPFTTDIVWAAGQTKASVVYPVPEGLTAGQTVAMTLTDGEGNPVENGMSSISVVPQRSNSVANPYWIGECTAESLKWGEWTMDLDLATNKAAAAEEENAYTLVLVTGSLWCPDCFSIEPNVFEKPEFTAWAAANHVIPVILDVKVTVNDANITLLGYGEFRGKSGASYRSRKGILQAEADPVIERNLKLRNNEIWRLPGTDRPTMWVPTVLLLRKDGTIAGRMNDDEIKDPTHKNPPVHPLDTNLARLDELLLLADDRFEENDCHWSSTERLLAPGKPAFGELQANDRVDVWRLDAGSRDGIGAFRVRAGLPPLQGDYSLKLYSVDASGTVSACAVSEKQEDGGQTLTGYVPFLHEKGVFLEIRGSEEGFPDNVTNSTSCEYAFSYAADLIPQDADASWTVDADEGEITLALESNRVYRITSNPANCLTNLPDALVPVDEAAGLYRWTAGDGSAVIGVRPPCTVEYRIFEPGAVGFAAAGQRVGDFAGTAEVTLVRTGGKSGPLSARVCLDADTSTAVNGVRYKWTDRTVEWADGDAASKTVTIPLTMTPELEGEQDIVLKLDPAPEAGAGIARHAVTLFDTDKPVFEKLRFEKKIYTRMDGSFRVKVYNIKTGKSAKLNIEEGKLPRGIKAKYDRETQEVVFSGAPSPSAADAEYRVVCTVSERREDGTAVGLPVEFVFPVAAIEDVAPGYGTSLSRKGIPMLLAVGGNGARILAGTLDLSLSRSSRISARYKGLGNGRTVSFSAKGWGAFDPDVAGGVLTANVENRRSGQIFELAMSRDGLRFRADVHDPVLGDMTAVFPSTAWSAEHSAAAYEGLYTVALPQEPSVLDALPEDGAPVPTGAGYLTLKIAGSSLKSGSVRYAGCYPNGSSISGSGTLIDCGGYALLPVFSGSRKETLSCMLTILPGKKDAHEGDAAKAVCVPPYSNGGVLPYWHHEERGYAFTLGLNPYGSYYDRNELLSDCCLNSHGTVEMRLVAPDAVAPSERYGDVDPDSIPSGTVEISGNKILPLEDARNVKKLSLKASSGIVSGSFSLGFMEQRRPLSLTFKGVVTPGWFSCPSCGDGSPDEDSHPFISGTAWFTDRHGNRSIRRSIRIDLDAGPVPEAGVPGT